MLNPEKPHPEYFEELCALAAGGLISESELVELQDHLQGCTECRSTYSEFTDLVHNKLPLAAPDLTVFPRLAGLSPGQSAYRARFLSRARKQGLAIPQTPSPYTPRRMPAWRAGVYGWAFGVAVVIFLATTAVLSYRLHQSNTRYGTLAAEMAAVSRPQDSAPASRPTPEAALLPASPAPSVAGHPGSRQAEIDMELLRLRQDLTEVEGRAKSLQEQLQASASDLQSARTQFSDAQDARHQLEMKLTESDQLVARFNRELQSLREERSKYVSVVDTQDRQIRTLSGQLRAQSESLEQEKTLSARGREALELMGARNLHVFDVQDLDSKGKDSKAIGHILYTEGKPLVFYAFGLGNQDTAKRGASFQVWGSRGPTLRPAQSLGILNVDDPKQNRWVLTFEDAAVLAKIDYVFVTVERPGGSPKPTSREILVSYLRTEPNHP